MANNLIIYYSRTSGNSSILECCPGQYRFDTAYVYDGGNSEKTAKAALVDRSMTRGQPIGRPSG